MAQIYPKFIDSETKSSAERNFYQAFFRELDDDWVVFHQVRWIGKDDLGRPRDGEADFVVAHPRLGVLVVEVKGGRIGFDASTGRFTSTDRHGRVHEIGDPFQQATVSKHVLLEKLRNSQGWPRRRVLFGHAVAFPDAVVEASTSWLRPNAPREIIIDAIDLVSLNERLRSAFTFWNESNSHAASSSPPGRDAIQVLERMFAHSAQIRHPLLAEHVRADNRALVTLTQKQFRYLRFLSGQRRAAIAGCAGSGKTFLAVQKARALAEEGLKVLFTCYNRPLADYIGDRLGYRQQFDVFSFHQLCAHWANRAGERLPVGVNAEASYFKTTLPNALLGAIDQLGAQYDAIIVDEGQDFRAEWWEVLPWLLHQPAEDQLYIFFDDNQRIYRERSAIPIQVAPYVLDENCRNTRRIFDVVGYFYSGTETLKVLGPDGQPHRMMRYRTPRDGASQLRRLLHQLINESGFRHDEIAILTALGRKRSEILGQRFGNFQLTDSQPLSPHEVFATTIRRFKGLDRAVVVLCEVDGRMTAEDAMILMYVGTSRAKSYLVILIGEDAPPLIRETLIP